MTLSSLTRRVDMRDTLHTSRPPSCSTMHRSHEKSVVQKPVSRHNACFSVAAAAPMHRADSKPTSRFNHIRDISRESTQDLRQQNPYRSNLINGALGNNSAANDAARATEITDLFSSRREASMFGNKGRAQDEGQPTTNQQSSNESKVSIRGQLRTNQQSNSNESKVVFLDVDGVLHSVFASSEPQFFRKDCMQRLKRLIDNTGAKVVLSSAWRKSNESYQLVQHQLRSAGIPMAIDRTRIGNDEYQRHTDIEDFVQKNPKLCQRWIALDDLPMFQLRGHYVGTSPEIGLTDQDVDHAIKILNSETSTQFTS